MFKKFFVFVLVLVIGIAALRPASGGSMDECSPPPISICGG